jgi:hypothetical protein
MARCVDLVEREASDGSTPGRHVRFMIAVTCFTAPVAAAMLGDIAHCNFGLSRLEIHIPAIVGAVVIATLAAIDFLCRRLRKP